ncbi:glycosyltransferase family 87 protein [Flavobacterium phycosphaerae]|uniref:glycosyltransferase family 87 protein n=1 Tax=Flavobacterium phycosphaerae TaxID=2697515 RepID=UPI001389AD52|nr:glycosyltransferase family 87 protein [Flavobacterium phycosphaerae]
MKKALLKYYGFLPLLLLCGFYLFKAMTFPIHDFANYYFGGHFLAEGHFNSTIYFPYEFNKAIADLGHQHIFASYAPNTPFLAVLFALFSFLAVAKAKLLFNILSIVLFVISIVRLFSHYKLNSNYALLIPLLFLVPIKNELLFGQVYFLLFFLLAEGWLEYEKKRWKTMALFWSLAILLKVFPVLLVFLLLFKKEWKPLFYLILSSLLLFGMSLLFTGFDIWVFYLKEVLPKASQGEIATAFVTNYQSVFMFLKQLLVFDAVENPGAIGNQPILFTALMVSFKVGLLIIGFFISKRVPNLLYVLAYWILTMILLSPYGSTYTLILLLFPFLALLKSEIATIKKAVCISLLFLINNLPLSIFIDNTFPFSYLRLLGLLLFFGILISFFYKTIRWKMVALLAISSMILVLVFQKKDSENSVTLLQKSPILIYDYKIENNLLTYYFWDENGREKKSIPCGFFSFKHLDIKNNQVFYNTKQLTFDRSHKLKPILIDNNIVIYLSDLGRGIGFYTLRKTELH